MQYVLRVFCYSWVFQVLCFTWRFSFVPIWKRLEGKCFSSRWMNSGPRFWCRTEANGTLTGPRRETQNTPSSPDLWQYACCVLCLTRRRRNIPSVGSGLTALKILFCTGCCSIVVSADLWCKYTKLLFFVFVFVFVFLLFKKPFLPSGFVSAELLTDANKDKLDKKAFVSCCIFFFFLRSCKASWETPVKVDVYTTVVWSDSLWELIV